MRLLPILAFLALTAPAYAQGMVCEASDDGAAGEVTASLELNRATGDLQRLTVNWTPRRFENVGFESEFFARPALGLDYRVNAEGGLVGPTNAYVMITRVSAPGGRGVPSMADMKIRATAPDLPPLTWSAVAPAKGEAEFAQLIRDKAPAKVTTDLLDKGGKILASADFDFSKPDALGRSVALAKAAAEKRAEAYRKLAGEGAPPARCPR